MRVLVTGGAGYIGSHVVAALLARGDEAIVADDLSGGDAERVAGVPLLRVDLAEPDATAAVVAELTRHPVDAVIHLAARKRADESVERPLFYYAQNLGSLGAVLAAAADTGVARVVFSSSAAVYASSPTPVTEDDAVRPSNPYGETKLAGEWLTAAHAVATGGRAISLRYFNVAGTASPSLADRSGGNIVPLMYDRLERGEAPRVFGTDYDTPDGSCVRDYVHVADLADAHLAALDALAGDGVAHRVYNVGTGTGVSVLEMAHRMAEVSGVAVEPELEPRRPGDPAVVVADTRRIRDELGWTAQHDLTDMLTSAWAAR